MLAGEAHAPAKNGTGGATLYRQLSNGSMVENGKVLTSVDIKAADIDIERLESLDELKQLVSQRRCRCMTLQRLILSKKSLRLKRLYLTRLWFGFQILMRFMYIYDFII